MKQNLSEFLRHMPVAKLKRESDYQRYNQSCLILTFLNERLKHIFILSIENNTTKLFQRKWWWRAIDFEKEGKCRDESSSSLKLYFSALILVSFKFLKMLLIFLFLIFNHSYVYIYNLHYFSYTRPPNFIVFRTPKILILLTKGML